MSPLASLRDVSVRLADAKVLESINLTLQAGELVGVVGPNGAGKTTLLRTVLGLVRPQTGEATLGGLAMAGLSEPARSRLAAYLPQDRRVAWSLPAWRVAALGALDRAPAVARRDALAAMERVGLAHLAERGVLDMSGGERARVLLARLLVTRAPLLVADEPAAGLDPDAQFLALELLQSESRQGRGAVVTLHDLGLAARVCDRLVVLDQGRIVAQGPPREALRSEILAEVFGLEGQLQDSPAGLVLAARRRAISNA
ncbi:MAG: ABC transporter ATP-binding protein [Caulobacteraceae bacterium]|nr:ABC transporter ATP-binding protein [Caulobacteraceae bacterium]